MRRLAVVIAVLSMLAAVALFGRDPAPQTRQSPLGAQAASLLRTQDVAGVVLGSSGPGRAEQMAAVGVSGRDPDTPIRPDDRFHVGSITKTFVAAAVLQQVGEGRLSLDDPVAKFVSVLPAEWGISIRHLLSHQSGLPEYNSDPRFLEEIGRNLRRALEPAGVVELVLRDGPRSKPGEKFEYAGTNYLVLGLVVEQVASRPLREELDRRFFRPLSLGATELPEPGKRPRGLVQGYSRRWAHLFDEAVVDTSSVPSRAITSAAWAEGGLVSSVPDLLKWTRALYGGDVLPAQLRAEMTSFGADKGPYGLGTYRFNTPRGQALGHGGVFFGYRAEIRYLPERGLAVAAAANGDEADLAGLVDRAIAALIPGGEGVPEPQSTDAVIARLRSGEVAERREAALELGRRSRDADRAVPVLAEAVSRDGEPPVRAAAALALGLVGRGRPGEAEAALAKAAQDPSPQVREAAGAALDVLKVGGPRPRGQT